MYLQFTVLFFCVTHLHCLPVQTSQMQSYQLLESKTALGNCTRTALEDSTKIAAAVYTAAVANTTAEAVTRVKREEQQQSSITPGSVLEFMKKFGYLEEGIPNSEVTLAAVDDNIDGDEEHVVVAKKSQALYTEEAITDAVKNLQRFGGINPTGEVDSQTLELLVSPRCGNKDVVPENARGYGNHALRRSKRFIIGSKGWKKRRITYHLSNWTPKLGSFEFAKKELSRAFESWSSYANLNFVQTDNYYKADIRVAFGRYQHGDYYPFDGPGFILAHAYYPYEFGDFGGDIHFDEDEDWQVNSTHSGLDFFTVAVHEIGHSLGLSHSPVYDSIMYPYYKGAEKSFALGYDDILAMYQLYIRGGVLEDEETEEDPETASTTTTTTMHPPTPTQDVEEEEGGQAGVDDDYMSGGGFGNDKDYVADEGDYYNADSETEETKITTITTTASPATTQTYYGDYEEVDDHIRRTRPVEGDEVDPTAGSELDLCSGRLDSLALIRGELLVFLGRNMWRFTDRGRLRQSYPAPFSQMFGFPDSVSAIDAVYERPRDGHLVFFTGKTFWINDGNTFLGGPRPISDLGLPSSLPRVDAAFIWGKNKKTYIFSGEKYWRYDEDNKTIEVGYPRLMSSWRGVPTNLDSVFTWTDGTTYFFKQGRFWSFDDSMVITSSHIPLDSTRYWFGC